MMRLEAQALTLEENLRGQVGSRMAYAKSPSYISMWIGWRHREVLQTGGHV